MSCRGCDPVAACAEVADDLIDRLDAMDDLESTTPHRLARLLRLEDEPVGDWQCAELGAILRHQLSSPLSADLALDESPSQDAIRTFGDLLTHPLAPVHLLELLKDFAKAHCAHPLSSLPSEVMKVLYYSSIVAARLHAHQRITRLSDQDLCRGLSWLVDQPWLEERTRTLLTQGLSALSNKPVR